MKGMLRRPQCHSGPFEKEEALLPLLRIELRFLGCPSRSRVSVLISLSRLCYPIWMCVISHVHVKCRTHVSYVFM
jgi:hypothetical protein